MTSCRGSDLPEHRQHGIPKSKPVGRWCQPGAQSPAPRHSSAGGTPVWPVWKEPDKQWISKIQRWIQVRDDIRKRMWLTSDQQTRISEVTGDDTLLDIWELDLGPGTGSDVPQGQVRMNATQVDSDEEPLMRSAITQQEAPVLCAGLSRQLSPWFTSKSRPSKRAG